MAQELGLSEQTVSEGLAQESISFDHVVDRFRAQLGAAVLKAATPFTGANRFVLGYEGPTSFNSAFARWTGRSALPKCETQLNNRIRLSGKLAVGRCF